MLKFGTKMVTFPSYWLREHSLFFIASVLFPGQVVGSAQVCKFCFQRSLLGVGDQHTYYHHGALTFHYSNPPLSWPLQMEQKEKL